MTDTLFIFDTLIQDMGLTEKEIQQRKSFLQFSQHDTLLLKKIHGKMDPIWQDLVSSFYDHLLSFKEPEEIIQTRTSVERLRQTQNIHFNQLTGGQYEKEYIKNRLRVGLIHEKIGVEPKWYIGAYCFYIINLLPRLFELCNKDNDDFLQTFSAFLKVIMFDISLALDTYFYTDKQAIKTLNEKVIQHLSNYADNIINHLPAGILVFNEQGKVLSINPSLLHMLGVNKIPLGTSIFDLPLPLKLKNILKSDKPTSSTPIKHKIKNKTYYYEIDILSIPISDKNCSLAILRDITEKVKYETELSALTYLSTHDPLTNLPNRAFLYNWFKEKINSPIEQNLAILFIDLDGFKKINDSFGHYVGDLFLEAISGRLAACVKKRDLVVRLGGDEFCIILTNITSEIAVTKLLKRIQARLFQPIIIEEITIIPKASIGVSFYPKDGQDILSLIKNADEAMYQAKGAGGGTYSFSSAA